MKINVKDYCCTNPECKHYKKFGLRNIGKHSFYNTKRGKFRRLICKTCRVTFSSTKGTVYYKLQKEPKDFDEVVSMSVEGQNISSIARVKNISRNRVTDWILKASIRAEEYQNKYLKNYEIKDLQFDEIKTFSQSKKNEKWIFTSQEVSSRLWLETEVGRRSYNSTEVIINNTINKGKIINRFIVTTDGFEPYLHKIKSIIGLGCVYAQVIKSIRKNRVSKVDIKYIIGDKNKFEEKLLNSEDSKTVNTSFIERLNLTIRSGSSYLTRKTTSHAKMDYKISENLTLFKCYYNFIRPHKTLKFGTIIKTPAWQAGLTSKAISFREIFSINNIFLVILLFYNIRLSKHQFSIRLGHILAGTSCCF